MNKDKGQIYSGATPSEVEADLFPLVEFHENGISETELRNLINDKLIPHLMKYDQPVFQSMFNGFPEPGALMGAQIALQYNQGVTNWQVSPGGAMLEELCCKSLCRLFGLADEAEATFMYSGTYANQEAIYLALHKKAERAGFDYRKEGLAGFDDPSRLLILASKDVHLSIKQSVYMLGLGEHNLHYCEVDKNRRIDAEKARHKLAELRESNDICCIVATAGTTSTGAIDPIMPLVDLANEHEAWLHVDGAYGLAYSLVPEYKKRFEGIHLADSISWDPHKQMGIPIPNSILFLIDRMNFSRIAQYSHYFNREEATEPNPGIKSPPTTRPMSSLSLLTSMLSQGMNKVRARLKAPIQCIEQLAVHLNERNEFEVFHQPDTGILCFRIKPEKCPAEHLDEMQTYIYDSIMKSGERSISITQIDEAKTLRLLAIAPQVTYEALLETIEVISKQSEQYLMESGFGK